jgi:predicted flap endonuclease-1-like 5' DNA nuclease
MPVGREGDRVAPLLPDKKEADMANLEDIEGIGPAYAEKLATAGLKSTDDLLETGGTPAGRDGIAEKTGIAGSLILEWVNHADLYRIKGVGSEYADLLEEAGVDSVPELAQRNAANLTAALAAANETKNLVRSLPSEAQVTDWIAQAKGLERAVHH